MLSAPTTLRSPDSFKTPSSFRLLSVPSRLRYGNRFHRRSMDSWESSISDSASTSSCSFGEKEKDKEKEKEGGAMRKPHKAQDAAWEAIAKLKGCVGVDNFKLIRRLGSGDLGNVYLCELKRRGGPRMLYAMKVVDKHALACRNKLHRAYTETAVLAMLDHPFLPTLYAHFDTSHYSCIVMEFCPGGDLHSLRQRQPLRRFSLRAARFYAAEVVVALEYLHMMGIVYRDLKPENVLLREDGHIMLSDFDLAFRCDASLLLLNSHASTQGCVAAPDPLTTCLGVADSISRSSATANAAQADVVMEPRDARSKSFVGTHEYLAPEVISGRGHGSAVDWWTLGIFLHELLYGRTPFRGPDNAATLTNILTQTLRLPAAPAASERRRHKRREAEAWEAARELMMLLLQKDPRRRLGTARGAAEVKSHPFFKDVCWPLIRCSPPPHPYPHPQLTTVFRHRSVPSVSPDFDYF